MEEDGMNEELNEQESAKILEAYLQLTRYFSHYVKQMDPALWKNAVDYAKTFTDVKGVTLFYEGELDGQDN